MSEQAPFIKLTEYLTKELPSVNLADAKKAIITYRKYMHLLRGDKDQASNFCDICYNLITDDEASKTTIFDFNFCCTEHSAYRNALQLDLVRREIGLKVEHLPMLDIYK